MQEFLGLVNMFTAIGFSEKSPVMHLNKHISRSQKLQKYLSYEANFFFLNIGNLILIPKMQKKNAAKYLQFFR